MALLIRALPGVDSGRSDANSTESVFLLAPPESTRLWPWTARRASSARPLKVDSRDVFLSIFRKSHLLYSSIVSVDIIAVMSDKAIGDEGYLTDKGMIPLSKELRDKYAQAAAELITLKPDDLLD